MGVGRLVSIENWWFSGSMLIYQGVVERFFGYFHGDTDFDMFRCKLLMGWNMLSSTDGQVELKPVTRQDKTTGNWWTHWSSSWMLMWIYIYVYNIYVYIYIYVQFYLSGHLMKYQDQPWCPCVWMGFSHALLMFVAINGGPCDKPGDLSSSNGSVYAANVL